MSIRQSKGGGTREVTLPLDATAEYIITIAKELFFPEGWSSFGREKDMSFFLANYKQEIINEVPVGGVMLSFTVQRYVNATKLPKVRLYLASRLNTNKIQTHLETDQESCKFATNQSTLSTQSTSLCNPSIAKSKHHSETSDLEANRIIKSEQDKAFQASLEADQAKDAKKKERSKQLQKHIKEVEEQEELRKARTSRVPDETEENASCAVLLQVRHLTLGNIKRYFNRDDQIQSVYDWVGSLSLLPKHFELSDFNNKLHLPDQNVTECRNTTLYMSVADTTPSLDQDVNWKGFGSSIDADDDTLPLRFDDIPSVESLPPENLLMGDGDDDLLEQ